MKRALSLDLHLNMHLISKMRALDQYASKIQNCACGSLNKSIARCLHPKLFHILWQLFVVPTKDLKYRTLLVVH